VFLKNRDIFRSPKVFNPATEPSKSNIPKIVFFLLLFIIIAAGLWYILIFSSFFKIKNISVEGHQINNELDNIKGQNILLAKTADLKNEIINKYPEIQDVKIMRGFPDTLRIKIETFQPQIAWRTQDKIYLINSAGIIIKEVQESGNLPIVQDNKSLPVEIKQNVLSENFISFISELNNKFNQKTGFNIRWFEVDETFYQVESLVDQGWRIKFNTTRPVEDQLEALSVLLAKHKEEIKQYADVRVEGRVFYK